MSQKNFRLDHHTKAHQPFFDWNCAVCWIIASMDHRFHEHHQHDADVRKGLVVNNPYLNLRELFRLHISVLQDQKRRIIFRHDISLDANRRTTINPKLITAIVQLGTI